MMFPAELGGSSLSATAYQRLQQCPLADPPCGDQKVSGRFWRVAETSKRWTRVRRLPFHIKPRAVCAPACPRPAVGCRVWHAGACAGAQLARQRPGLLEQQERARLRYGLPVGQWLQWVHLQRNAFFRWAGGLGCWWMSNYHSSTLTYYLFPPDLSPLCPRLCVCAGRCCLKSGATGDAQLSDQGDQMYYRLPAGTTAEDGFFTQRTPWGGVPALGTSTTTTAAAPSSPGLASGSTCLQTSCSDAQPPAYSCSQEASWGKCGEAWMQPYCQQTCKRCPCAPADAVAVATPTATSSAATPGPSALSPLVPAPTTSPPASPAASILAAGSTLPPPTTTTACTCTDVQPNRYLCTDEARWGKCSAGFMQATKTLPEGKGMRLVEGGQGALCLPGCDWPPNQMTA